MIGSSGWIKILSPIHRHPLLSSRSQNVETERIASLHSENFKSERIAVPNYPAKSVSQNSIQT